jgi:SAM-dependent methyltransferase
VTATNVQRDYVLGHGAAELARLDLQAASLAPATRLVLTTAGLTEGMRVLDLGTGTGEVAFLAAEMVGPSGEVVGVDRSGDALDYADRKRHDRAVANVRFTAGDLSRDLPLGPFDAVIGRLVLPYLPDPIATIRAGLARLRSGGLYVAMEYDIDAIRSVPSTPLASRLGSLIAATFDAVGTSQSMGPHLADRLRSAGGVDPVVLGLQSYLEADDPIGPAMLTGVLTSLLPAIERHGLGTAAELDLPTVGQRVVAELATHQAVFCPPGLVGAWARRG